jgi:hypothetical protein
MKGDTPRPLRGEVTNARSTIGRRLTVFSLRFVASTETQIPRGKHQNESFWSLAT